MKRFSRILTQAVALCLAILLSGCAHSPAPPDPDANLYVVIDTEQEIRALSVYRGSSAMVEAVQYGDSTPFLLGETFSFSVPPGGTMDITVYAYKQTGSASDEPLGVPLVEGTFTLDFTDANKATLRIFDSADGTLCMEAVDAP